MELHEEDGKRAPVEPCRAELAPSNIKDLAEQVGVDPGVVLVL